MTAVAGFGRDGAEPLPVLRLRRLHADGAAQVKEITLPLRAPGGSGEQLFAVDVGPARYDAELGLSDAAGGWLMLARSNVLEHGARVDVRLSPAGLREIPTDRSITAPAPSATPRTDQPQTGSAVLPSKQPREQFNAPPDVPEQPGIRAVDVLARRREGLDQGPDRDPGLAHRREAKPSAEGPLQPDRTDRSTTTPSDFDSEASASRNPVSGSRSEVAGPEPAHSPGRRSSPSPTAPMRYGQPTPGSTELMIEAELRINGCAAPGSLIDLFGHPYRVGPGGRFQLVIRVDDPELIKRAFELNPPNLPDRSTDA
ncbi:hypothetical protein [Thiocapsa marina]|uniref:Uncharacterized protein n=1 Tax=Thiocapsa marina 5811 TaxID=768671 RepID=F9UFM1_9GAMM|nr:hypothetical protein [Thiocapsa marina]EGV16895.1 hypothetical protein ThimaDRAFT_3724 [Thiocapsa marina 5811]